MDRLEEILLKKLDQARDKGAFRRLRHHPHLIDFCSNDYFGLASNKWIEQRAEQLLKHANYGINGSAGSRLISGHHTFIDELEALVATRHGTEASLLLNSGYNANMAVLSSIPQKNETIFYDELCHASIKDGMRLSFADRFSFKHNNLDDLKTKLQKQTGQCYVVVESIYSMDGDLAPLIELCKLCIEFSAILIVDEAHSTGVMGSEGSGMVCSLGLGKQVPIRVHTYGKAMGAHGACVVGSQALKDYLINFARPFIYTTALPLSSYASIYASYEYLTLHYKELQEAMAHKIALFKIGTQSQPAIAYDSPIMGVLCPSNDAAKTKATSLQQAGFDVRPILSPTVPLGKERLRVCLHVFNKDEEIKKLAQLL